MLISAILLGLLGSFHCIGMCGPIAFMLPVDRTSPFKQFFQISSYHLGRLSTYAIIGLLFGLLGKGFFFFGFQQHLAVFSGVAMIVIVLFPVLFQRYNGSKTISTLLMRVKSALGKELKNKQWHTFYTIGFLNGFLPCGLVYMAVFGALTMPNAGAGSLYMFLFGMGTIPLMTAVVYVGNRMPTKLRAKVNQFTPIVVVCIGLLFVLRGLGLGIPYISPKPIFTLLETVQGCF